MKIYPRIILFAAALATISSCLSEADEFDQNGIERSVSLTSLKSVPIDSVIHGVKAIALQEDSLAYVKNVTKMQVVGHEIFILDRSSAKVVVFDTLGRFVELIENAEEGPGSIPRIYDFDVNKFTGNIDLLSPYGHVVEYDRKEKSYSRTIDVSMLLPAFYGLKNVTEDIVVFYSSTSSQLAFGYSRDADEFVWTAIENEGYVKDFQFGQDPPLWSVEGKVYFYDLYGQQLILVASDGAEVIVEYDFGENNFEFSGTTKKMLSDPYGIWHYLGENKFFYPISNLLKVEDEFIALGRFNEKRYFISTKEDKGYKVMIPDIGRFEPIKTFANGYVYGVVQNPSEVDSSVGGVIWRELEDDVSGLGSREANPIVIKYRLR